MEGHGTSHNKLEEAGTFQKQLQTRKQGKGTRNKEKPPSWWAANDIDRFLVVLNSVNSYLK